MDSYGLGARGSDVDEQEETSTLRLRERGSNLVEEWTDEKHSLFLESMEATFVNQLNRSLNLFTRGTQKNSQPVARSTKHKFKVLRDGRWSKPDLREGEAEAEASHDESRGLSANPWIQHYRCSEKHTNRNILTSSAKDHLPVNQDSARNFRLWRRHSVGTNAEMTGQNFNEECLEEDKSNTAHEMKRTRTSISNRVSSIGQVVPSRNILGDDVDEEHAQPGD